MAYNSVEQHDQMYYQDSRAFHQDHPDYELRSIAPSVTSYKGGFVDYGTPTQENTAYDCQHLLRGPIQDAQGSKWSPGLWRRFPVFPILSLLGVLASTYNPKLAEFRHL
jgi:hypothetical protein